MTDSPPTSHNLPAYSVSEVSQAVKGLIEDNFGHIRVRGEVSGFKKHGSGHLYFTLKDDKAVLSAVCWKGVAAQLAQLPEDGLEVICSGRVTTYPGQSKYQIVVTSVAPAGVGALMALLEKRKLQLAEEGLFDEARKQPLPFMPQVIGVITSPTGAVIRDILHRIAERFPVHVLVWPVAVQGDNAAQQVAKAISGFNAISGESNIPRPDLLIVARGGGSIEDLWPFNEEITVRAVAASTIPVISAVGHETDTTLIDYVADRRAPTPTAAAEMAVPVREEWLLSLGDIRQRQQAALFRSLEQHKTQMEHLSARLPRPERLMELATQRLDDWQERLSSALPTLLQRKQEQLQSIAGGIRPVQLMGEVRHRQQQLAAISERYHSLGKRLVTQPTEQLASITRLLESYHYRNVLKRGFVALHGPGKALLTRAEHTQPGQPVTLEFYDGKRKATLSGKAERKIAVKNAGKQPGLFDE